jgi:molecular chaperone GrpE
MSEPAPPVVPGTAAVNHRPEILTPERIDNVLADFRAWLEQAAAAPAPPEPSVAPEVDLHTLLAQFVALRHEVNLQTRASRSQQEQNAEALRELNQALELLERREAALEQAEEQKRDEHVRPLLKTLIELYDALALARREVQRVQEALGPLLERLATTASVEDEPERPPAPPPPPAPRRWFWQRAKPDMERQLWEAEQESERPWRERLARQREKLQILRQSQAESLQAAERARQFITSVVTGYTMSLQRLERALHQQGLEPISALGQPFDPETMEVVEVVPGPGRTSTEVIDEVRRGYLRGGRVFRFAQVRVAKP